MITWQGHIDCPLISVSLQLPPLCRWAHCHLALCWCNIVVITPQASVLLNGSLVANVCCREKHWSLCSSLVLVGDRSDWPLLLLLEASQPNQLWKGLDNTTFLFYYYFTRSFQIVRLCPLLSLPSKLLILNFSPMDGWETVRNRDRKCVCVCLIVFLYKRNLNNCTCTPACERALRALRYALTAVSLISKC